MAAIRLKNQVRVCPVCGTQFKPAYVSSVYCSKSCRMKAECNSKKDKRVMTRALLNTIPYLKAEVQRLKQELYYYKTTSAREQYIEKFLSTAQYCERLALSSKELPCGKYDACFTPDKCERVPQGLEQDSK